MTETTTREEMIIAVRHAGELIHGDPSRIETIAEEWADYDFSVTEAEAYWKADVFTADAAAQLRDAGVDADNERLSMKVRDDDNMTYGYAIANGDVSLKDILPVTIGEWDWNDSRGAGDVECWLEDRDAVQRAYDYDAEQEQDAEWESWDEIKAAGGWFKR